MAGQAPDLLAAASPREILLLASRTLVDLGADMATSHLCDGASSLALVGHDGFDERFLELLAVVRHQSTCCATAAAQQRPVMVADVATDPVLAGTDAGDALLRAGSRACLAHPLVDSGGRLLGVISAHWRDPGEREVTPVPQVAAETARRLESAKRRPGESTSPTVVAEADNLRRALLTRTVISQAAGILMARQGVDEAEAFDILRRASQRTNRKLRDIATEVVARVNTDRR